MEEDYNEPCDERKEVLQRLHKVFHKAPIFFWALCQVLYIDDLTALADIAEERPSLIYTLARDTRSMMAKWRGIEDEVVHGGLSCSTIEQAAKRDKSCCVLTGLGGIEYARIIPYQLLKFEDDFWGERHAFWRMLENFWGPRRVTTWKRQIFPNGEKEGVETTTNIITLTATAHRFWTEGYFALKPVSESEDKKTLRVQFFWQKKLPEREQYVSLLQRPLSTRESYHSDMTQIHLARREPAQNGPDNVFLIRSGTVFTMETDDPALRPLPNWPLLEMQWFLRRALGMAGAECLEDLEELDDEGEDDGDFEDENAY